MQLEYNITKIIFRNTGYVILFTTLILLSNCENNESNKEEYNSYITSIHQWQDKRVEGLKQNWLSLRGLYWLREGENSFGSDSSNQIIFPKDRAPELIGIITLNKNKVTVRIAKDIEVLREGNLVDEMTLQSDELGQPTLLEMGTLRWHIIKRGDRYGVRLRDSESPFINDFEGIESYVIDKTWRIKARYEPNIRPVTMTIHDVLGTSSQFSSPGALVFQINGKSYKLNIMSEQDADQYWLIFADETSGRETYGSGRYLYVEAPGETGFTYIDFNKAYNPPCAFTEFATCPLAPAQNILPVKITAGEKSDH